MSVANKAAQAALSSPAGLARRQAAASSSGRAASAAPPLQRRRRAAAATAAALPLALADLAAAPAQASEAFIDTTAGIPEAAGEAASAAAAPALDAFGAAAQEAVAADPTDLVFTALFGVAIAALSVVTLGVAYLSFTSWMDGRVEAEDRARADSAFRGPPSNSSKPKKEAPAKQAEEFKGFGTGKK